MNVVIINSPLVQLNTPYPSGAYLSAFFKEFLKNADSSGKEPASANIFWYDLSIQLFYSIFSRQGLTKLFQLSSKNALKKAEAAEKQGDEATAFNLRRYVATQKSWIEWIDSIVQLLCGKSREKVHQMLYSPYAPRGSRMENYLAGLNREPNVDDDRFLCSFALADLADYIKAVFDPEFSLIRYAEALTVDESSFEEIEKRIDSPVLTHFYKPVLETLFGRSGTTGAVASCKVPPFGSIPPLCSGTASQPLLPLTEKTLFCISVPFAGTFVPALYTARYIKENFGSNAYVVIGGGFVNTELRQASSPALAKYLDAISYDRGYGSYYQLISNNFNGQPVYKLRQFTQDKGKLKVTEPLWQSAEIEKIENQFTKELVPDYTDIDFSIYPSLCDDLNPMHRLWVDGAWIKAYLAHGCYWHKCAFCDTQLDYVCAYQQTDIEKLYYGLLETARKKNIYGIHFVDEALPPVALKKLALLNARNGNPLYFWGNVRFEKNFTYDLAALLSYCGFGGASAGIEAATNNGLQTVNKGTDIQSIVNAACAFKENGILVHAYMIYGFWNDTPQSIIDSLETLRQLFAEGLLDSAFWHKFVLTRNSTVYEEYEKGQHPDLKPIINQEKSMFAKNNLHFQGEQKYNKYGAGLDSAVNSWMHGQKLDMKVTKWFDFSLPEPRVPKIFIPKEIQKYENKKSETAQNLKFSQNLYWIASDAVAVNQQNSQTSIVWYFMQEEMSMPVESVKTAEELCFLLNNLRPESSSENRTAVLEKVKTSKKLQEKIRQLHGSGIIEI